MLVNLTPNSSYVASTESQMSKVTSVLKSLTRDWSDEGKAERQMSYVPIIDSVRKYVPVFRSTTSDTPLLSSTPERSRIIVPGAGVGRLMCDLCSLGYSVQGNEFSLYMLLASDFILNGPIKSGRPIHISPWLLETRNLHSFDDQTRVVAIPDKDPYELVMETFGNSPDTVNESTCPDFSMVAGDFVSIYSSDQHLASWDCVAACFFLDASPSIVEYLQVCYEMLRPTGLLISFGPLLWHWSGPPMTESSRNEYLENNRHLDSRYLESYDFSWSDIKAILINIGFEVVESNTGKKALYTADCRSMMHTEYQCLHFVARKKSIETVT
jgi:carnosine N-methyltransferase